MSNLDLIPLRTTLASAPDVKIRILATLPDEHVEALALLLSLLQESPHLFAKKNIALKDTK